MGLSFDETIWRANLLALAERALDYGFPRLYDLMVTDDTWDSYAVRGALKELANAVSELAAEATQFANDIG